MNSLAFHARIDGFVLAAHTSTRAIDDDLWTALAPVLRPWWLVPWTRLQALSRAERLHELKRLSTALASATSGRSDASDEAQATYELHCVDSIWTVTASEPEPSTGDTNAAATAALVEQLRRLQRVHAEHCRSYVLELTQAVLGKLIREQREMANALLARTLEDVLSGLEPDEPFALRVHPDDAPHVRAMVGPERRSMVVDDADVQRGGCILEGAAGRIDARVETQIETLLRAIAPALEGDFT